MTKKNIEFIAQISVIVVLAALLVFAIAKNSGSPTGFASTSEILPSGIPTIYGNELKIRYDDVSVDNPTRADKTIAILGNMDVSEKLEGTDLERYINILYKIDNGISCEYCCGARAVIFENGEPACGCAHSYAMRGLAKYLIKFHGDEFTDKEILEEISKWKILFFPGIHEQKAEILKDQGIEIDPINLATNLFRGIEKGKTSGGMVGDC